MVTAYVTGIEQDHREPAYNFLLFGYKVFNAGGDLNVSYPKAWWRQMEGVFNIEHASYATDGLPDCCGLLHRNNAVAIGGAG